MSWRCYREIHQTDGHTHAVVDPLEPLLMLALAQPVFTSRTLLQPDVDINGDEPGVRWFLDRVEAACCGLRTL